MDLLPPHVRAALACYPLGSQEGRGDEALVVVKYFFPAGRYTLYVTEAEFDGDDAQLFGYCLSPFGEDSDEWGYASLAELRPSTRSTSPPAARVTSRRIGAPSRPSARSAAAAVAGSALASASPAPRPADTAARS